MQAGADLIADPTIQAVVGGSIQAAYTGNSLLTNICSSSNRAWIRPTLTAAGLLAGDGSLPSADLATQGALQVLVSKLVEASQLEVNNSRVILIDK